MRIHDCIELQVSTVSFGFKYPFDPVKASNEDVASGYKNVRAGGCIFLSFSFFLSVRVTQSTARKSKVGYGILEK